MRHAAWARQKPSSDAGSGDGTRKRWKTWLMGDASICGLGEPRNQFAAFRNIYAGSS
jgi:hypothetical protein